MLSMISMRAKRGLILGAGPFAVTHWNTCSTESDQDRMLGAFEQMASGNAKGGFPLSRICCRMDWAVEDRSYIDDLVEFEARVNDVWRRHDDAVICTYQLAKFGGDTVIDIMRTHPMIIIGGILQQNPFFMPPAEFLREVRERRARRAMPPSAAA